MRDYYQILGVPYDADESQIKQAYYRLAKRYHPDVSDEDPGSTYFKLITIAYETLRDDNKRLLYDKLRLYRDRCSSEDDEPEAEMSTQPQHETTTHARPSHYHRHHPVDVFFEDGQYYYRPRFDSNWQQFGFHFRHVISILGFGLIVVLNALMFGYGGFMVYDEKLGVDKITGAVVLVMGGMVTYHTSIAWHKMFADYRMFLFEGRILDRPSNHD